LFLLGYKWVTKRLFIEQI